VPTRVRNHLKIILNKFFLGGLWMQGDTLKVKVNKLTSTKTQLPYSYYSLPYSRPEKIVDSAENLGEVLRGDRIENSPYVVSFYYICVRLNLLNNAMIIDFF
jgi:transmembrane 9 superfamily protein 2/4